MLAALARRLPVTAKVAIVAAHPDDETIGLGGSLHLFADALLVHVTDGAPRDGCDAAAAGAATWAEYARLRRAELARALAIGRWRGRQVDLAVADQRASFALAELVDRLASLIDAEAPVAILTHPYEGGHPDHDATAFAVHRAARRARHRPLLLEFASYHADGEHTRRGAFLAPEPAPVTMALTADEQATKIAMLAAFASQAATLAPFPTATELVRLAPAYEFAEPPHPGLLNYERYAWGMTGARWRALAASSMGDGR